MIGNRFLIASLCGLVLAGIVHISTILLIPLLGRDDAFSRLIASANGERAELIARPGTQASWPADVDPASAVGACAYTLEEGPVRFSLRVANVPQTLSLHARGGGVFFAITDRAALRGVLEIIVVNEKQMARLKALEDEDNPSRDIRIISPRAEGVAIIRALAPFPSQYEEAEQAVQAVRCTVDALP